MSMVDGGDDHIAFPERIYHCHSKDAVTNLNGRNGIVASHLDFGDPRRGWDFRSLGHGGVNLSTSDNTGILIWEFQTYLYDKTQKNSLIGYFYWGFSVVISKYLDPPLKIKYEVSIKDAIQIKWIKGKESVSKNTPSVWRNL